MFTLIFCLQTIKQNGPAPHSDAFLGQRFLSLTLYGRSTSLNCAITTVQYRPYQYGHVVEMVRCDWPFTVGYIIKLVINGRLNINKDKFSFLGFLVQKDQKETHVQYLL